MGTLWHMDEKLKTRSSDPDCTAGWEMPTAESYMILFPDDPWIRDSIAIRRDRIEREGESFLWSMWRHGMASEPLYVCCPACGCQYGLYVNQEVVSSLRSIHEAYLTVVCFLETEDQCPKHLQTEIAVKSLLYPEEAIVQNENRGQARSLGQGAESSLKRLGDSH